MLIDTNQDVDPDETRFEFGSEYIVTGRSLLMFELVLDKEYAEARAAAPGSMLVTTATSVAKPASSSADNHQSETSP